MYVIFPAEEVVSYSYGFPRPGRPRPRPTLDTLGQAPFALAPPPSPTPGFTTAPPDPPPSPRPDPPASPTPSVERPPSTGARSDRLKERAKAKLLKKLGKFEDPSFGKISRTPDPENFELPAPLPTPAFNRRAIFDRDFDALFESSHTPHFGVNVRVVTPEPQRKLDVTADHFPSSISASALSLLTPTSSLPPRPHSAPHVTNHASSTSTSRAATPQRSSYEEPSTPKSKKVSFFRRFSKGRSPSVERQKASKMAAPPPSCEMVLRELTHPTHNEHLKTHNAVSFKLVKTVSDFASQLSHLYEQHSSELQLLVSSFRKRNAELRKERTSCPSSLFHTWESLLQEVEADVVSNSGAASNLEHLVARPLIDKTFHVKLHARKLFAHRDGCEAIMAKADDKLAMSRQDYKAAFVAYISNPNPTALAAYYEAHNNYVQQLTATNGMLDQYHRHTLPTLLQELEEVYTDLTTAVSEAIYQGSEVITNKCLEQHRRYESLCTQARAVSSTADLAHLARALLTLQLPPPRQPRRSFTTPHQPSPGEPQLLDLPQESLPPVLRFEIVTDRVGTQQARLSYEQLKKDAQELEIQIKLLQDSLESLARIQQRSLEGNLFTKVNELQEEISLKKYDYRAAQLHLAAIRAQECGTVNTGMEDSGENDNKIDSLKKELKVIVKDINASSAMKPTVSDTRSKRRSEPMKWDDESVRYKINMDFLKPRNNEVKRKSTNSEENKNNNLKDVENKNSTTSSKVAGDDDVLYKFPDSNQVKPNKKVNLNKKPKSQSTRLKVKFWSSKEKASRDKKRSHSVLISEKSVQSKVKNVNQKLRSKVSSLPPPLFTDQHVPMVTVPDDLTVHFNQEEANDLLMTAETLYSAPAIAINQETSNTSKMPTVSRTPQGSSPSQSSPRSQKRKHNMLYEDDRANDSELEFFAKYIVQKLRKMETNQRIYSENLINTVLMLGQLRKLNGKSRINDT